MGSYQKAAEILPRELIEQIQQYADGICLYIPRRENARQDWGAGTEIREELRIRDENIFADSRRGLSVTELAKRYYLSEKSIQRVLAKMRRKYSESETAVNLT